MRIKELSRLVEHECLPETGIDANHAWLVRIQQEFQECLSVPDGRSGGSRSHVRSGLSESGMAVILELFFSCQKFDKPLTSILGCEIEGAILSLLLMPKMDLQVRGVSRSSS